jgi:hypothetical protein
MISGKMIFFSRLVAFWKMLWKIFNNVVRKIEQKGRGGGGAGVRRAFLENGLRKNWM